MFYFTLSSEITNFDAGVFCVLHGKTYLNVAKTQRQDWMTADVDQRQSRMGY